MRLGTQGQLEPGDRFNSWHQTWKRVYKTCPVCKRKTKITKDSSGSSFSHQASCQCGYGYQESFGLDLSVSYRRENFVGFGVAPRSGTWFREDKMDSGTWSGFDYYSTEKSQDYAPVGTSWLRKFSWGTDADKVH